MSFVHVMLRVLNFERSKRFYAQFGLVEIDRYDLGNFEICYLGQPGEGTQLELIRNVGRTEPYGHGEGFGNLSFAVPDAAACRTSLLGAGAEAGVVKDLALPGGPLFSRYFFTRDPDGYRVEVLEMVGRWVRVPPDNNWNEFNPAL